MSVLHILYTQNTQDVNSCGPAQSKQSKHYQKRHFVRPCTVATVKTASRTTCLYCIYYVHRTHKISIRAALHSRNNQNTIKNVISLSPAQSQQQKRLLGQHVCIVYIIYTEHTRCQYVGPCTFEIAKHQERNIILICAA